MFRLFGGLQEYFKIQQIKTDLAIFRLHTIFTTVLLLASSLILTASQYVGQPIACISKGVPNHVINTFCWISSTFVMPDAFNRNRVIGSDVAHPGITNDYGDEDAKKYHTYYQWVCFVLFFQACACYTPKFIWDSLEGGVLRSIAMNLNLGICQEDEKRAKKDLLIDYLLRHLKHHKIYAYRYFFCEFLCLANIISQLYLMNKFLGGEFIDYGLRVLKYSDKPQEERYDPMIYMFPRMTKCDFYRYGPSGTIQKHDSLCILPLNIVNEKTYIFIWFWFFTLLVLLLLLAVYRLLIILFPEFRSRILISKNRMVPREITQSIASKVDVGDFWILYMLGQNLDPIIYRDVLAELTKSISNSNTSKKRLKN